MCSQYFVKVLNILYMTSFLFFMFSFIFINSILGELSEHFVGKQKHFQIHFQIHQITPNEMRFATHLK